MRVIFTIHHYFDENTGEPGSVYDLCQELNNLGHQSRIFSFDDLPPRLPHRGRILTFPWFVRRYLNAAISKDAVDVVDASEADAWLWNRPRGRTRPLVVLRTHGLEQVEHLALLEEVRRGHVQLSWKYPLYWGGLRLRQERDVCRRADVVCVLNRGDREYLIQEVGIKPDRIRMYRYGLRESFLALGVPKPVFPPGEIRIAQVGSYSSRKGSSYGPQALNRILVRNRTVHVGFFGTGRPTEEILGNFDPTVHARVTVVESYQRNTLPMLLKQFHIKLLPSLFEGLPIALLEAMACGLAPIVSATAGSTEAVVDGQNGIVVPERDSDAIEAAIERLIDDQALLERLRVEAYRTAQSYNWRRSAEETIALYDEFLARLNTSAR